MRRRQVLAVFGSAAPLGGCLGDMGSNAPDGHVQPDGDPETVPEPLTCDEEFERYGPWIDREEVEYGDIEEDGDRLFALRVNEPTFERGETVQITLANTSGEQQRIGNPAKLNVEVYTEAGWQDVRGWEDGTARPITDELRSFPAGGEETWTFEFTEDGIVDLGWNPEHLTVCPGLPEGRYRFSSAAPQQGDVAVAFDLVE